MLRIVSVMAHVLPSLISATEDIEIPETVLPDHAEETDPSGPPDGMRSLRDCARGVLVAAVRLWTSLRDLTCDRICKHSDGRRRAYA